MADSPQTAQGEKGFRVIMFADFICPYCYIGQERMEQLARDYDVAQQWRPYWLHPETPREGTQFPPARTPIDAGRPRNGWRRWRPPRALTISTARPWARGLGKAAGRNWLAAPSRA